eukprot:9487244-Pyramimonas_sp.AAC.1
MGASSGGCKGVPTDPRGSNGFGPSKGSKGSKRLERDASVSKYSPVLDDRRRASPAQRARESCSTR